GRDLRGLDLDGGASLRVAALAGGALANFEAAETGEVDTATALQLLRDEAISREEEINDLAGLRLRGVEFVRDGLDELLLVHGLLLGLIWWAPSPGPIGRVWREYGDRARKSASSLSFRMWRPGTPCGARDRR